MRWSYSRLTSFEHCKYEFYLNYIVHDDDLYLAEGNFYAEVGSFVHEILEKIFKGELSPDDASQYYVDNFDSHVFYKAKKPIMDKAFETCADYFATVDFGWLNDYEILGVEMKTEFEIAGYKFVGYIDLLVRDKRDGRIVVIDHKSSKYPFKNDGSVKADAQQNFDKYKKQMHLYSYAVKELYGEFPKEIIWNHFKDGGRFAAIPFSVDDFNEAVKWFEDTIHQIEAEDSYEPDIEKVKNDYFYCTQLCSFRKSCEYCKKYHKDWRKFKK